MCKQKSNVHADALPFWKYWMKIQGVFVGNISVLGVAKLAFDQGVSMQLTIRSENEEICNLLVQSLS